MKFKIILSLMAFATTALFTQTAANASPRFEFEPNVWKKESVGPRSSWTPAPAAPTVRSGSTPSASSMLGIPLASIKRAPAPVHAAPVAQPNIMAQLMPAQFNNAFGKPAAQAMPMTASPNVMAPVAQAATPKTVKMASAPRSLSRSQNGTARLRRPSYPQSRVAQASPIKTYNTGYVPGSTAPSAFGSGHSTTTAVSGVVKYKH
ncbi:hypothetical protein KA344_13915 [bacterium]|nr:hypothetical protein [bacterium]